ncbi:MAG: hypothetical protein J0H53_02790 [Rhizobiales bacterium]|nr:hypothetical protein [Hyphomicrobiales bacterium]
MGEIPEDVTRTARDVAFDFDCDWTADGRRRGQVEEDAAVHAIARAILAERERCARVAESFGAPDRYGQIHGETYLDADIIADAIRKGD